ncbi:MAG: zf-TFIIB domain-containing protein [Candidatus Bathyarchaeota archaeon]|nr:zf-TFIIB domain-containing protein [Candidatus Bathyarchaeota archaeon]
MRKCSKCDVEAAMHRATVYACPNCGSIVNADELYKLLEGIGIEKKVIEKIRSDIAAINL